MSMQDPFITALNSQKAAYSWFSMLTENVSNMYTPGFREQRVTFADFVNGVYTQDFPTNQEQGKSIPGRLPSNLFIEGKAFFSVRKPSGEMMYTRLGDFSFNGEGAMVNDLGYKVQGYLLGEDGKVMNTGISSGTGTNDPTHADGGPGHPLTTDIVLWVDPNNGKYFGKYDEYKVRTDGTVVGVMKAGNKTVPLYKIALSNFMNPSALQDQSDNLFTPTVGSGEPVAGTGEVRSGLLEKSNVLVRDQVAYLQQAKLQMDVTSKMISTNKNLLEEALRLLQ